MSVSWQSSAPAGVSFGTDKNGSEVNLANYNEYALATIRLQIAVGHQYSNGANVIWMRVRVQAKKNSSAANTQTVNVTPQAQLNSGGYTSGTASGDQSVTSTAYATKYTQYAKITGGDSDDTVYARMRTKPLSAWVEVGATSIASPIPRFTLTYNGNGGSGTMTGVSADYGGTVPAAGNAFTAPTGYVFSGWNTSADGTGTAYAAGDIVTLTSDVTLYAQWTARTITATFKLQGGKIGGSAEDVTRTETYDSAWVLPADPTRDGYTFAGWYTAASGGTQITNATTVSVASNTTVYAQWTGNEVTCTYDARGGTVNPAGKTVTVGSAYGELPTPTRAGYRFLGWWATVLGNTEITPESTVTATGNHTIYARWEPLSVLRYVGGGEAKTITNIKVVESGTVRNIVGCYSVESGVVKQGV